MHVITTGLNNQSVNLVIMKLRVTYAHKKLVTAHEVS